MYRSNYGTVVDMKQWIQVYCGIPVMVPVSVAKQHNIVSGMILHHSLMEKVRASMGVRQVRFSPASYMPRERTGWKSQVKKEAHFD